MQTKWLHFLSILVVSGLLGHAAPVWAVPLQNLVDTMQAGPGIMAGQQEEREIGNELLRREERAGWSLFGSIGAGHYQELDRLGKEHYEGVGGQLGLRYPLLGAMQARQAVIVDAEIALEKARQTTALTRAEQQQQLRQTYIDWWRQSQLRQWCAENEALAVSERSKAAARTRQQQLRVSEQLWVTEHWDSLLHVCETPVQRDSLLRQQLAFLYGGQIPMTAQPHSQPLPAQLAVPGEWQLLLEEHPTLRMHRGEEEALQQLVRQRWSDRVEANFTISQQFDRRSDLSGHGGGTVAGITFEVPIASLTAGRRAGTGQARQLAAQYRVQDTRQHLMRVLNETLQRYQQAFTQLERRSTQVQRMQQLVSEQQARLDIDNEPGFMNLRLALVERAKVELEMINDWHAAWSVLAQLQVLTDEPVPTASVQQRDWKGLKAARTVQAGVVEPVISKRPDLPWRNAAYVWDSRALLDEVQRSGQVQALKQAGFNHVHLGFTAGQVEQLAELTPALRQLVEQLRQQGISTGLLLGDPGWMLAEQRHKLVQLIDRFAGLPFSELHLDLEVEQLGWPVSDSLLLGWLETLRQVSQRSKWPVTLVSHHRWFAPAQRSQSVCIPCVLPELDIDSVTLMLYSTALESTVERTAEILKAWPELQLHLAQSVEAELEPQNSWSGASVSELQEVAVYLQSHLQSDGLRGLAWQDWAEYLQNITKAEQ